MSVPRVGSHVNSCFQVFGPEKLFSPETRAVFLARGRFLAWKKLSGVETLSSLENPHFLKLNSGAICKVDLLGVAFSLLLWRFETLLLGRDHHLSLLSKLWQILSYPGPGKLPACIHRCMHDPNNTIT